VSGAPPNGDSSSYRQSIEAGDDMRSTEAAMKFAGERLRGNYGRRTGGAVAVVTALLLATGCSGERSASATDANALQSASAMAPSDVRLAGLYQQSCRACHATGAAGAPVTGDRAAWDARWSKGLQALRSSTIRGLNGMPPGGQCFACNPEDYDALIRFMAAGR
jgi:cytochrome c5